VVSASVRKAFWDVSVIFAGPPQLKRMTPPFASALASAVSVQLVGLPVPTVTVVGLVSAVKGVGQMAGTLEAHRAGVNKKVSPLTNIFSHASPRTP
jgi:hypothetical protein